MTTKILDVKYVHAAAGDCSAGAIPPPMYKDGDVVTVDLKDADSIVVELSHVDASIGEFLGKVRTGGAPEFAPGDDVSFYYQ
ncbi:hypothetical protein [Janthinobacterium sp. BJB304]|uniref:hypothetical protein n=1 Tax=Janthinobacterium sp. BJB304 TaxID=1572871 RepID=UPI00117B6A5E|nr:hypothetical protein [Janthinobacterium sp. BJB304]